MNRTPYLKVVGMPREMGGKGAPKPTVFGVLGRTKMESMNKVLGGLVETSTPGKKPKVDMKVDSVVRQSDHHLEGAGRATHISGEHYGQVPYAGKYMAKEGSKV